MSTRGRRSPRKRSGPITKTCARRATACGGGIGQDGKGKSIGCTVRVFRLGFALEDAIGSHACSFEALAGV